MNLSRRSLLTGLLSSAAVIAARPVAKVMPAPDAVFDSLGNSFETYTSHFRLNPTVVSDDFWRYCVRVGNIGGNALEDYAKIDNALALEQIWGKQSCIRPPGPLPTRWGAEDVT